MLFIIFISLREIVYKFYIIFYLLDHKTKEFKEKNLRDKKIIDSLKVYAAEK